MFERVCAWCKIDLDTGQQLTDEEYNLTCHLDSVTSHGICPPCEERAFGLQEKIQKIAVIGEDRTHQHLIESIIESGAAEVIEPDLGHFDEPTRGQRNEYYRLFRREASSDLTRGEIGRLIRQGQRQR